MNSNINKDEIFKVLGNLNIEYDILMSLDKMDYYPINGSLSLYSKLAIQVKDKIIYFGFFPFAKEIKANNRNKHVIITDSSGVARQKFKYYQSWFPKIVEFYKMQGLKLTYILFSKTSEFKDNKVLGFKAVNPNTLKECLRKNLLI